MNFDELNVHQQQNVKDFAELFIYLHFFQRIEMAEDFAYAFWNDRNRWLEVVIMVKELNERRND
jgi:hypothetical protein